MLLSFERFSCGEGHAAAAASLRTANENVTRVTPLIIMLTPTNVPIVQTKTRLAHHAVGWDRYCQGRPIGGGILSVIALVSLVEQGSARLSAILWRTRELQYTRFRSQCNRN